MCCSLFTKKGVGDAMIFAGSSNGRTVAFEAIYPGSNPGPAANL